MDKITKFSLAEVYLNAYANLSVLCSSRELCQEELFYLAKGSLTFTFQVCSTLSAFQLKFRNSYQRNHHAKCQYLKS